MVAGVILGGIYTAKRLIPTPLYQLKERADDLMNNVSKVAPRRTAPKFLPKKPRRKVILGVGSFIAEKTDIAPEVVRAALVIMAFLSAGTVIPAYFITGFILNAVQKDLRNNDK
jgi:phage shock protein PspC (stress-responsive transcriptional regulator)